MLVFDTSVLLAALDDDDSDHQRCIAVVEASTEPRLIPALTLTEVDYWCHQRLGAQAAIDFQADIAAGWFQIELPSEEDFQRALEIQKVYIEHEVGVVDALTLATVERLGEKKLATLDHRHFGTMRPRHVDALELIPAG